MTTIAATPDHWYNKTWLVILLCFFVFPVGLYALWKSTKIATGWKIGATAFIGLLVVAAIAGDPKPPATAKENPIASIPSAEDVPYGDEAKADNKAEEASETIASGKILFENANDFKAAFNKFCHSNSLDFEIGRLKVEDGEVQNTFSCTLNDHLAIIGSVNKSDGTVKEVTMIGSGNGTAGSGGNILLCMMALIATVEPDLEPAQRTDVLKELGFLGDKDVDIMDMSTKTDHNGIHYWVNTSKTIGVMFGASRQ